MADKPVVKVDEKARILDLVQKGKPRSGAPASGSPPPPGPEPLRATP